MLKPKLSDSLLTDHLLVPRLLYSVSCAQCAVSWTPAATGISGHKPQRKSAFYFTLPLSNIFKFV